MISALLGRFAPYIIVVLGLAVVGAGVTAWVQSARLEAAQQEAMRVAGERDAAVAAAAKFESDARRAANAERVLKIDLAKLRGQYENLSSKLRAVGDDGCLDREHPASVGGLFSDDDQGAGDAANPGVPGTAPGS